MFPIYILDGTVELPKEGTFYVVSRDGIFLSKDTGLVRALVKVNGISFLQELKAKAELRLPKIPSYVVAQALLFFRRVYQAHKSEAAVLLYYSKEAGRFVLNVPLQEVSYAGVDYKPEGKYNDGLQLVGSIHSHCDFNAFHSGIDRHDESDFDGIHITIGRVDQPYFTVTSSVAVNNNRFPLKPGESIIGLTEVDFVPPAKFLGYRRRLGVPRNTAPALDFYGGDSWLERYLYNWGLEGSALAEKPEQFYDLVLPEGKDYRNCPFPQEWMARVEKKKYTWIPKYGQTQERGLLPEEVIET